MLPALALTFTLAGALGNGLDCTFTERCRTGLCDSVEAPLKVLFTATAIKGKPSVFLLGDRRLFEGEVVTDSAAPAMRRMFGDFGFQRDSFAYAPGGMAGYDPAPGAVQILVGGRLLTVGGDGKAELMTLREGMPALDWITSFSGQCRARTYE